MVDILGFHTVSVPMLFIYSNSTNQRMLHLHGFLQLSLESDLERRLTIMDRCFDFLFPFLGPDFLAQMQCAESVELQIAGLLETISKQIKIEGENGPISNYSAGKSSEYHNFRNDSFCTVVTGYWQAEISKYSHSSYEEWLPKTLSISMPYIIFSSAALSQKLLSFRSNNPTRLIEKDVTSFVAKATYPDHWIHQDHMPSATLGIIWLEKMHLLYESSKIVSSEYLVWVDSGISFYRNKSPPVGPWSRKILNSLPKDRMSYSLVSEDYHSFAGICWCAVQNLTEPFINRFCTRFDSKNICGFDHLNFSRRHCTYNSEEFNLDATQAVLYGVRHLPWGSRRRK